ncbi:MAG: rane-flanked domain protein [Frankiales bacterium]|nr:rane-flanked domain protein [Frankiales bacterium]
MISPVAYPKKLLSDDETVALETHPHWKTLVLPVLELLVVLGLAGFLVAVVSDSTARYIVVGVAIVLVVVFTLVPFLRWRTTMFVITNKRVVVRSGILSRTGRDIPLTRVNDVTFTHNLLERILGCGTLLVESAGERGQVQLTEIPKVEQVQRRLYELVEQAGREL